MPYDRFGLRALFTIYQSVDNVRPMSRAIPFGLVYLVPLSLAVGMVLGGGWTLATVVLIFVITPPSTRSSVCEPRPQRQATTADGSTKDGLRCGHSRRSPR